MASYEASIKVLVEAQQAFRAIQKLEDRLKNIQDKATKAQIKGQITESARDVRRAEQRLKAQIDLNAATELYQRRLTQINRAGGARNEQQRKELSGLAKIVETQGDNARIVQKVATATGRILEVIRETNRTDKRSNALQSQVRAYKKQIDLLREAGIAEGELNKLIKLRDKLSDQQSKKQLDLAAITKDQLDRKLKLLQTEVKLAKAAEATAAAEKAKLQQQGLALRRLARGVNPLIRQASGLDGPVQQLALPNTRLLGAQARGLQRIETSEERIARFAQRTAQAKAKSAARTRDILEANKAAARAGERNAKAAERTAAATDRTAKSAQRSGGGRAGNILVGAAFPALFGAGPAGIIGGGVGEAFGPLGGVVGSAIGAQIDTFIGKVIELGKALNPTTADIDAVIASLGAVGKPTADLIKRLEELAGKQVALKEATARLALIVGDDGVRSLQELGDASTELGNALSKVTTQILADAAKLLAPITQGLAGQAESVSLRRQAFESNDPRIVLLRAQIGNRISPRNDEELAILKEIENIQKQINEDAAAAGDKALEDRINELSTTKQVLAEEERKLAIARLNGDILNDKVFNLEKEQIYAEYNIENQRILRDLAEKQLTYQEAKNGFKTAELALERGLLDLTKKRVDAEEQRNKKAAQAAERAAREAQRAAEQAAREEKQRINALVQASLSSLDLAIKTAEIDQGRLGAIERELNLRLIKKTYQEEAILLNNEDLQIQQIKLDALDQEIRNRERVLNLERASIKLANEQQKLDAQRGRRGQLETIRKESAGFTAQLADPFNLNTERVAALEAEQRASEILRAEREKLVDLEYKRAAIAPYASAETIQQLASQIEAQKAFIPELEAELILRNQLEAAANRQTAIMQKYGFIANEVSTAMTSAVQAVVTGTGTVEEAFATMFQNIGRAFIDMATQMLAQKLFLTVLQAFAGPSLSGGGPNLTTSSGVSMSAGTATQSGFDMGSSLAGMFKANGGPVTGGSPYIVGERGPELFVPQQSGAVVNNDQLSSAMSRYRRGANGGSMSSYDAATESTGTAAAVMDKPIDVRYSVERINSVDYVTADQFQQGMRQAAQQGAVQGEQRTLRSLRQNTNQRRRIGI